MVRHFLTAAASLLATAPGVVKTEYRYTHYARSQGFDTNQGVVGFGFRFWRQGAMLRASRVPSPRLACPGAADQGSGNRLTADTTTVKSGTRSPLDTSTLRSWPSQMISEWWRNSSPVNLIA